MGTALVPLDKVSSTIFYRMTTAGYGGSPGQDVSKVTAWVQCPSMDPAGI